MLEFRPRLKMLKPLSIRDFALLWTGMSVSMLGDGITFGALAWHVYELSNLPIALSTLGVARSVPLPMFAPILGVVSVVTSATSERPRGFRVGCAP